MVRAALFVLLFVCSRVQADEQLNIAVTASFKPVVDSLSESFTQATGIRLNISSASTGVLFQQVVAGAPFDIFFAADDRRPQQLVQTLGLPELARQTYAIGQLVLVSNLNSIHSVDDLAHYQQKIVIANPQHAPYGHAAKQVLDAIGFTGDKVLASNVTQARQYLSLGLADVGLIAASVAQGFETVVEVERTRYDEIRQQLVVMRPSDNTDALLTFMSSPKGQQALAQHGYINPQDDL